MNKKIMKKNEKGAITLFVLLSCLFFVFILTGIYTRTLNKMQTEEENIKQIQENYAKQIDRIDEIYEDLAKDIIVTLSQEPENDQWTNQKVILTGNARTTGRNQEITGYAFNTEENETNISWVTVDNKKEISQTQEITENGTYYFWVTDGENVKKVIKNVTNIDKTAPKIINIETTTNSLKIKAEDTQSGINGYIITTSSTRPNEFENCTQTKQLEIEKTGLKQNTTYYIWLKDEVGNISVQKSINTGTVPGGVTLTATPKTWTNENVTVTAQTTSTGYTLQTSTNGTSWGTTNPITFSANGTMYARLYDGTNAGKDTSYTVTNIDKNLPTITLTGSASSIIATQATLSATVADNDSGISKIIWYYKKSSASTYSSLTDTYTTMNGSTTGTKSATKTPSNTTGITTGLSPSTTYNIYAVVYDVAGNSKQSNTVNYTTGPAIAEYNSVKYTSIQNAINAVSSTGTVKVLATHTTTTVYNPSGKNITLNMDSKTVTLTRITNEGTLTINGNGTMTQTSGPQDCLLSSSGIINIANGTFNSSTTGYVLYIGTKGTVNITGGTFNAKYDSGLQVIGTLNLSGGTINLSNSAKAGTSTINVWAGGKVNFSGGRVNRTNATNGGAAILIQSTSTLTMSGNAYAYSDTQAYATVHIKSGGTFNSNGGTIDGNLLCEGTKNGSSTSVTR